MSPPPALVVRAVAVVVHLVAILAACPAAAQSTGTPAGASSGGGSLWTAMAGYATTSLRDIAATGVPVDASPVALVGHGPVVLLQLDRPSGTGLQRYELEFSRAGGFSHETPVGSRALDGWARAAGVRGRYEYRRYVLRDLGFRGFDAGVGAEGIGDYVSVTRGVPTAVEIHGTNLQAGVGVVAAARLHRWQPLEVEATWVNTVTVGRSTQRHEADTVSSGSSPGGGWSTRLRVTTTIRVGTRTALTAAYGRVDGGFVASHQNMTSSDEQLVVGLRYGR